MCVSVFSDCSRVTFEDLQGIGIASKLKGLILQNLPAELIKGHGGQQDPWQWLKDTLNTLNVLFISGKLQRHINDVDIRTIKTGQTVVV